MTKDPWLTIVSAQDLPTLRQLLSELPHEVVLSIAEKAFREVICANFAGVVGKLYHSMLSQKKKGK